MKKILLIFILAALSNAAFSQQQIDKGEAQLNAGLGFSSWGLPVYVGLDYAVHKDVTIGGELSFRSYHNNWNGNRYNHTIIGFLANGNYHFNTIFKMPPEWDFYAGGNIGFYFWSSSSDYLGTNNSGLGLGGQVGGRYFFNEKVSLNLELGGGTALSNGKFGITYQF